MDTSEAVIEGKPIPDRDGSFVIRIFGLFAVFFGLPYLTQGVSWWLSINPGRYIFVKVQIQLIFIALDFVIGFASISFGIGLFLRKEWAREIWLAFLIVTILLHCQVIVVQTIAGIPASTALYKWIGVVLLVTIISWAYLSKAATRARFH